MSDKKFVEVCVGIGMNQFFPEYSLIEIPNDVVEEVKVVGCEGNYVR